MKRTNWMKYQPGFHMCMTNLRFESACSIAFPSEDTDLSPDSQCATMTRSPFLIWYSFFENASELLSFKTISFITEYSFHPLAKLQVVSAIIVLIGDEVPTSMRIFGG